MKKIYLHIGTHKTGTTSFQQLIRHNAQALQAQNIYVPAVGKLTSSKGDYQLHKGGLHLISNAFKGKANFDVVSAYLEAFENSGCTSACLSSEGFDELTMYEIQNLANVFSNYQINILLVLRHPLSLAKSLFCSKGAVGRADNLKYLSNALNNRRLFNYSALINNYSSVGRIKTIKYEDCDNINLELLKSINAIEINIEGSESRARQSLAPHVAIANRQIYSALGVSEKTYLNSIYPYLIEFADIQANSNSSEYLKLTKNSPFPADKQKVFMKEWGEMVFDVNCSVMQEDRWASWREIKPMGDYVNPVAVSDFKENFLYWLFSTHLTRKKILI